MSKKLYTNNEMEILQNNQNIKAVSPKSITYSPSFKVNAVKQSKKGMTSTVIFENAGLSESLVGKEKPYQCVSRCKKKMELKGEESFQNETRGKGTEKYFYCKWKSG